MPTASRISSGELAALLRPSLLRLTRIIRNQRADMSVPLGQLSALGTLRKSGPMSAGELAAYERVQPPTMTKIIGHLEDRGLIRRSGHPTDRRQAILEITDAGKDLLERERQERNAWLTRHLGGLTTDERELLYRVIPVLDKLAAQQ